MQHTQLTGIYTGFGIVVYLLIFYFINHALLVNPFVYWGTLLVVVIGMASAVKRQRLQQGEKLEKRQALKVAFLVYVIAMAFFYAFYFLLLRYIDPSLTLLQKTAMEKAGHDVSKIDFTMTISKTISGYVISLLGGFLIAYLLASIMKRNH